MPQTLTIVARIQAKKDSLTLVRAELLKLIPPTRDEEGCIGYVLHQDLNRKDLFLFYETWASRELWQQHMGRRHLADFLTATEGHIADFTVNEMTVVA